MDPKFPEIEVTLTGADGNAFAILGTVKKALKESGMVTPEEIKAFMDEATSGDYDHLLQTCMFWVTVY